MSPCIIYDGREKNTNSQTNSSIKHISNTHGGVMQMKPTRTYPVLTVGLPSLSSFVVKDHQKSNFYDSLRA